MYEETPSPWKVAERVDRGGGVTPTLFSSGSKTVESISQKRDRGILVYGRPLWQAKQNKHPQTENNGATVLNPPNTPAFIRKKHNFLTNPNQMISLKKLTLKKNYAQFGIQTELN